MTTEELAAVEQRIAQNEPAEAESLRALRALVADVATTERPDSLLELRRAIDARDAIPAERRGLLQYVLMDMLDQRELEISDDRRLIVRL